MVRLTNSAPAGGCPGVQPDLLAEVGGVVGVECRLQLSPLVRLDDQLYDVVPVLLGEHRLAAQGEILAAAFWAPSLLCGISGDSGSAAVAAESPPLQPRFARAMAAINRTANATVQFRAALSVSPLRPLNR
ncbi:hypothetical protein ACF1G3_38820, partial [Streptomyces rochei]|uniref:hypothetical protein n=1 Tax=Streptomyces rochei TaxID=1928 RepID=UPI0036FFF4E0